MKAEKRRARDASKITDLLLEKGPMTSRQIAAAFVPECNEMAAPLALAESCQQIFWMNGQWYAATDENIKIYDQKAKAEVNES